MKILMTGSSGFVGRYLSAALLENGHEVIGLGFHPQNIENERFRFIRTDTTQPGEWQEEVAQVDAIINLAGANIFKRWSESYRQAIYDSRILTTRNLVAALPAGKKIVFCSTSAAGYYGDRGDTLLDETDPAGDDFLARVCVAWEKEAFAAEEKGARVVATRFGVVIDKTGGALAKMLPAYRLGLGGKIGSGRQWFPWIHLTDLIAAMQFVLTHHSLRGPVNFCAPQAVRNKAFSDALAAAVHRPAFFTVPSLALRLVAGELGSLVLNSQRVTPKQLLSNGFIFRYPEIHSALKASLAG
jgi:uncharacterized protein (TIGR01777 family)